MKPCFGYVRVSTVRQGDGVSLEAQKDAILDYARRKSLSITEWLEEKETAAKQGRPVFNRMVARLRRGEAKGLVIHKIDRSARNYHDWAIISDLADAGIEFHIATESFDFNTYGGRMAADFMAVVAANYVRNLKTEIRKGQLGQLKIGLLPWGAPVGYQNNGAGKLKTPDPLMAPKVRRAFELYAGGAHTIRSLVEEMRTQGLRTHGGRPLNKTGVEMMLGNPFYCGLIKVRRTGETFRGAHEALVTAALFERVQDIKAGRKVKKRTRHNHLFRGLFRCSDCDRSLIGEVQKGRVYYRCQTAGCDTKTIREDVVEAAVIGLLRQLALPPDDLDAARRRLPALLAPQAAIDESAAIKLQRDQTVVRIERLMDLALDGVVDGDAFQSKKAALLVEQRRLDQLLEGTVANTVTEHTLRNFLELLNNLALLYESAGKPEKRRIVEWATSNRTAVGRSVHFEPSNWLTGAKAMLLAPSCADARDNSRTFDRDVLRSLANLQSSVAPESDVAEATLARAA